MSEWQLIATAPQGMDSILVFVPGTWETPAEMHIAFLKRGSYHLQDEDHFIVEPTHWMPLPAPPK